MIETLRDTLAATRLCLAAAVVADLLLFGVLIALLASSRGRGAGCPAPLRRIPTPRKPLDVMPSKTRERPRKKRRKRKRRNHANAKMGTP